MPTGAGIRNFRWQDLREFTCLYNEIIGVAKTDRAFDTELMRQFLSQPACRPEENCFLGESGGSIAGFAFVTPELPIGRAVACGGVRWSSRKRGMGRALLATALERAGSLGASMLHVQAPKESEAAGQLLRSSGFRFIRKSLLMRWQGRRVPPIGLPEGFAFRPFDRGRDEEALTELQNAVFQGTWGFCPNIVADVEAQLRFKTCDPGGVILAAAGERLAAYNWTFRARGLGASTGWIAMTGVRPDFRGRGLGRAVVLAGMEYLVSRGVSSVELETDEQNAPAKDIYETLGFRTFRQMLWYEMSLTG